MKIAILGAGSGGCASAVDLTLQGHNVTLCSASNPDHFATILNKSGVEYSGALGEGFASFATTTNVESACRDADVIMIVSPASAHEFYADQCAPYVKATNLVLLNPGSTGGSLHVANCLRIKGVRDARICETDTLTYACRMIEAGHVRIYHKDTCVMLATLPAQITQELLDAVKTFFPVLKPATNTLETGLANDNMMLHPATMIMNAARIERSKDDFYFYYDGITNTVARMIQAVDDERLQVADRLGLPKVTFVQRFFKSGYTTNPNLSVYEAVQASEADRWIKGPSSLNHRFLNEDVGYGLVPLLAFSSLISVETPVTDAIVTFASEIRQVDYRRIGLTAERMGIEGLSIEGLKRYVATGQR